MKILFRRALLGVALALAAVTLFGAPANAADGATQALAAAAAVVAFTLDPALVIQLVVSTVLPLLVGLVTKTVTRPSVKALLLALLSLITSLLVELGASITAGTTYDLGQGLILALPTFLIAVGLHYGLWKPVGAATKAQELFDPHAADVSESTRRLIARDQTVVDAARLAVDDALRERRAVEIHQTNHFTGDPSQTADATAETMNRHLRSTD
jgi:hypothetical protein